MDNHPPITDESSNAIPSASLSTIHYSALCENDPNDTQDLFHACRHSGFFYLDMSGTHPSFHSAVDRIYTLEHALFELPLSELLAHDVDLLSTRKLNGYKPLGRNRAGLKGGKDGFETYALPKDSLLGLSADDWKRPHLIDDYIDALRTYCQAVNKAAHVILRTLSTFLQLPADGRRLENLHRSAEVLSPDIVRMLKYHKHRPEDLRDGNSEGEIEGKGVSHIAHTDLGSLTFLCTRQWGLQVQQQASPSITNNPDGVEEEGASGGPGESQWQWVPPPAPGQVIVNLGDMLSMLTTGYLKSCLHRVVPMPGQEGRERYSFVYLMRAEEGVRMKAVESPLFATSTQEADDLRGGHSAREGKPVTDTSANLRHNSVNEAARDRDVLTSAEWLQQKFMMLRGETWSREKSWILTGVKEIGQPELQ